MDTDMKSIIYFLGLYAPENIVGTVFAITNVEIDEKYDTQEVIDTKYRYSIPFQYTKEDIVSYLGDSMKSVVIHNFKRSNYYLSIYKDIYLIFGKDPNGSDFIDKVCKRDLFMMPKISVDNYITCEYLSITDIVKYHHYIYSKNNGWYKNYYNKLGINPAKHIIDQIYKNISSNAENYLYILSYILNKKNVDADKYIYNVDEQLNEFNAILYLDITV